MCCPAFVKTQAADFAAVVQNVHHEELHRKLMLQLAALCPISPAVLELLMQTLCCNTPSDFQPVTHKPAREAAEAEMVLHALTRQLINDTV